MIIPSRTHYGSGKEGARRLHKAGKPKETQKKYREAEKWATDSGPQVVELARELIRNWDSLQEFRKARKARQPEPDWGPLTVEVEDETAEEFKTHFILNPEISRDDVQRRLLHLRQRELTYVTSRLNKVDYARDKALCTMTQNLWMITLLESLDPKKYKDLYVVHKGSYFEYKGVWSMSRDDGEHYEWSKTQPGAKHHKMASNIGWRSYKSSKKVRTIADPENTIVNMASNPVAVRKPFLGSHENRVNEADATDAIIELVEKGALVVGRCYESRQLIRRIEQEVKSAT